MKFFLSAFFSIAFSQICNADIIVHSVDFIDNNTRSNFNSFENLPSPGVSPFTSTGVWVLNSRSEAVWNEGGIVVSQVFSAFIPGVEEFGIWTMHYQSGGMAPDGFRNWYPNGGDDGYTRITRADNSDFFSIGFTAQSGVSADRYLYSLRNDGQTVLQGSLSRPFGGVQYIGFSGGGFDEVLVRSALDTNSFFDSTTNGLSIDAIELTAVPEPCSILLVTIGSIGLMFSKLKRRRKSDFACDH